MSTVLKKSQMSGAEVLVKTLEARGTKYVFGIPGAKIDAVFDTLADSTIQTVVCRHEQNAAFIAGGIGRMTGKAGVAIATSGPGVSNLVTGLATANSEGDPLVALGGAVATSERLKQIHQTMAAVDVCKPVTKFSAEVDSSESIAEVVSNAFRAAEHGRPGAAFISLPKDIMSGPAHCMPITTTPFSNYGLADQAAIDEAARLIRASHQPVILLGMMASKGRNAHAIRPLLERFPCPVAGTFQSAGTLSAEVLSNFAGRVGQLANRPGDQFLEMADLVITIGYNPIEYGPECWNKGHTRPIIHIDVVPADIDNSYNPAVELLGDIAATLETLGRMVEPRQIDATMQHMLRQVRTDRQHLLAKAATLSGSPLHPMRLIAALQQFLTPDVTLCSDMGSFSLWLSRYLYSFRARQILISNGQQTLGVALPWAIAATLVRPNEKVLSISGDGGFLFSAMELETAVRLQSHLVHMIWTDGTYDMVGTQEVQKYGRVSGVTFGPIDPVKYAEAFGAKGLMIRSPEDIAPVLKQAFDAEGPVLIGVPVDYRDNHKLFENVRENSLISCRRPVRAVAPAPRRRR